MKNIVILGNSLKDKDGVSVLTQQIKKYEKEYNIKLYSSNKKFTLNLFNNLKSPFYFYKKNLSIIHDVINILITTWKRPKIIFCLSELYAPIGFILSKIYNAKIFIACYGTYSLRMPKNDKLYEKSFKKATLLCSSKYTLNVLKKNNVSNNIHFLNLFTDKNIFFLKKVKKLRQFVFCGGSNFYKRRKGFTELLNLIQKKEFKSLNLKLVIIGNLNIHNNTETYIFDNKEIKVDLKNITKLINNIYGSNFEIIGPISNKELRETYSNSLFNIMLSKHTDDEFDGYGLTHLEANACGTYSIGSKESGSENAIIYGSSFNPNDYNKIIKYIKKIEKNPYININQSKIRDVTDYLNDLFKFFEN